MQVRSQQGDSVDLICWRHLKTTAIVEQVLVSNPHIAFLGPELPMGTIVELPETVVETQTSLTQLWD
ncbi:tail protein X [Methylophilus sp. QUAN]|jgi:phage tail protein X|uniref:tail protein X n=1 Tax=Methylophilus sp. QUAN TaxID=2781020 RepID=UPI00188F4939|nr:tail protein X [Methylophilus sp. QUAN]MBF4990696.1 tail protein X [Methylophilus sp. QUAN]